MGRTCRRLLLCHLAGLVLQALHVDVGCPKESALDGCPKASTLDGCPKASTLDGCPKASTSTRRAHRSTIGKFQQEVSYPYANNAVWQRHISCMSPCHHRIVGRWTSKSGCCCRILGRWAVLSAPPYLTQMLLPFHNLLPTGSRQLLKRRLSVRWPAPRCRFWPLRQGRRF